MKVQDLRIDEAGPGECGMLCRRSKEGGAGGILRPPDRHSGGVGST